MEEYLTISEVANRLKLTAKTIRNKMATGIFREGIHYFRPAGMSARFKWSAVVGWMEQAKVNDCQSDDGIPMAKGYRLKGESVDKAGLMN